MIKFIIVYYKINSSKGVEKPDEKYVKKIDHNSETSYWLVANLIACIQRTV
jgi:hypothetical protein